MYMNDKGQTCLERMEFVTRLMARRRKAREQACRTAHKPKAGHPWTGGRKGFATHWTNDMTALLGKVPDAEIAAKMGIHVTTVAKRRRELGIEPLHSRRAGGRNSVLWKDEHVALMGTMTDTALAEIVGCSQRCVSDERNRRGIPPFASKVGGARTQREWSEDELALLGTMSDAQVAARVGYSASAARHERKRRGIDAHR